MVISRQVETRGFTVRDMNMPAKEASEEFRWLREDMQGSETRMGNAKRPRR